MVVSRSGGGSVVFVDKAAEAVVATDLPDGRCRCRRWLPRLRWLEVERAVGPLRVVVLDVDAQDAFEVAAVEDQQPVEALDARGSNEPLGDGVCLRRPPWRLDDPDASAAEDLVERAGVLAVAVADQQAHALVGEIEAEVARPRCSTCGWATLTDVT
jgi:hypothetical protein